MGEKEKREMEKKRERETETLARVVEAIVPMCVAKFCVGISLT